MNSPMILGMNLDEHTNEQKSRRRRNRRFTKIVRNYGYDVRQEKPSGECRWYAPAEACTVMKMYMQNRAVQSRDAYQQ
jgi:hypothetical protein